MVLTQWPLPLSTNGSTYSPSHVTLNCFKYPKQRSKLPSQVLKNIYHAFVNCHILYGMEMYGNTGYVYLDILYKLNNKLLSILQNKPLSNSLCDLYKMYITLHIHKLRIVLFFMIVIIA